MNKLDYSLAQNKKKHPTGLLLKRLFDFVVSLTLLILIAPILLLFALLVLIFSGRPIFFKQTRTGLNNQPFTIWKFRTMEENKDAHEFHQYDWSGEVPADFVFKTPSAQKITKIGRIYRKLSIDELPQLINVLKGDMSLVGPRPEIPRITKFYSSYQLMRLDVKPGMTGYAQVNGRSIINHGKKIEYDLYYVRHRSFTLDLKIINKTIIQVLGGKGAC